MESIASVTFREYQALKTEVDRLTSLVHDLKSRLSLTSNNTSVDFQKSIQVKKDGLNRFVFIKDIVLIKGENNYSYIFLTSGEEILTSKTIKYWQQKCEAPFMMRIHKSYFVNVSKISSSDAKSGLITLTNGLKAKLARGVKISQLITSYKNV